MALRPGKTLTSEEKEFFLGLKPEDVVVHLGDFGNFDVANKLNGNKILLLGNYERGFLTENNDLIDEIRKYFIHIILRIQYSL